MPSSVTAPEVGAEGLVEEAEAGADGVAAEKALPRKVRCEKEERVGERKKCEEH